MSIGSDIRDEAGQLDDPLSRPAASFSSDAIPYLLSTADALVILLSSLFGGIGYELAVGHPMPNILSHCAVGLFASFVYILRMSGSGYYDLPDSAKKPGGGVRFRRLAGIKRRQRCREEQ